MAEEKKVLQDMVSAKSTGSARSSVFSGMANQNNFFNRRKITDEKERSPLDFVPKSNSVWYKSKLFFTGLAILIFIAVIFIGNTFFTKANVLITLKTATASIDSNIVALKDPTSPNDLPFQMISIDEQTEKEVPVSGSKFIERKASGQIIVYNNFSSEVQRFVKNTRFQSADGKIFRINNAITVPGSKVIGGKTVPGSVEVTVYADQPGAEYNIALSDFTLPGLKDTDPARYKGFYARSKTPMTDGVSGEVVLPATDELEKARAIMDQELEDKLNTEIKSKIPAGYIFFKSLSTMKFSLDQSSQVIAEKGKTPKTVVVKENGKLIGVMFDLGTLAKYLAKRAIPGFGDEGINIDPQSLNTLTILPTTPLSDSLPDKEFSFNIKGNAKFIWTIDKTALKADLKGMSSSKDKQDAVFKKYSSITDAKVDIRPFWRSSFPDNVDMIIIESTSTPVVGN